MRLIITILFFCCSKGLLATNYYVSNAGSDANDGLTSSTAWQTLSKVNSYSASTGFLPGDSILLNRGDSWNEKLLIVNSGSVGNPIIVSAYGTGNKPLITGFQTATLTNIGNIWSGIVNAVDSLNTVLVNGTIQAKGRYPNANATNGGYLTFQSGTQTSITSSSLTGTPSYVGKECVVRTAVYILDVAKVSSQSTSTINFDRNLTYNSNGTGGTGFFFQNDSSFLDQQGEWCYSPATKRISVYSTSSPIVQVSTIDTLIYVNGHSYITFDNLSVQGANMRAFQFDSLSNITVQNCSINYSGSIALSAQKSSYLVAFNDSIQNSLSNGIYLGSLTPATTLSDTCNFGSVTNCYVKNTGILAGMGLSGNGKYVGVYAVGHKFQVINNALDSTGYYTIFFRSDSGALVKNNYVSNFCLVKNDGGGIGTAAGSGFPADYTNGTVIKNNIVVNGFYPSAGTNVIHPSACIYLDNYAKNVTVDSNFLYNGNEMVLEINQGDSNTITNNIMINNNESVVTIAGNNTYVTNGNTFKYNQLFSFNSSTYTFARTFGTNLGNCDSNYYSRPSNDLGGLSLYLKGDLRLSDWQNATGKDLNSKGTPSGVALNIAPLIVYNPTNIDSTITFSGVKKSLDGVLYYGSITLHPYCAAILFTYLNYYKSSAYKHYQ